MDDRTDEQLVEASLESDDISLYAAFSVEQESLDNLLETPLDSFLEESP